MSWMASADAGPLEFYKPNRVQGYTLAGAGGVHLPRSIGRTSHNADIAMSADGHAARGAQERFENRRSFATTDWTLVVQAAEAGTPEGEAALEDLCRTYWPPLYNFARCQGMPPADAEDLTQAFFADLLARGAVARADEARGRFRTFLLTSFRNFHSRQRVAAGRQKRGGGTTILSLEALQEAESQFQAEPALDDSAEKSFDRKWASTLIARAMASTRDEYARLGKSALFDALKDALWGGRGEVKYAEIGRGLGLSEGAVKVSMHRLRRRFGDRFRAEVTNTVLDPREIDDEIRHLLAAVSA